MKLVSYKCDSCGETVNSPKPEVRVSFPSDVSHWPVDLCPECVDGDVVIEELAE